MKRILLFLATNLAVLLVISVSLRWLGIDRFLSANGLDMGTLMVFSVVVGFAGSMVSLLISRPLAKWSTGAHVIETPSNSDEAWLLAAVRRLAQDAHIGEPQVAIYEGAPNAFATGAFRDASLVAISTGLLQSMSREEAEAVLGHEVAHVANGDMVTLALIQGVVNTFVVFLARIVGYVVDSTLVGRGSDQQHRGTGPGYYATVFACEIAFGLLASIIVAWFSRQREFRADAGSARLLGTSVPMMAALARLGGLPAGSLPQSLRTFGITDMPAWLGLFASHPPIEARIAALQQHPAAGTATSR
ncbi:protease HtpX [Aquabacterium sp. A7-Y]|uniref:protease HtpX n=1 Tax=Aquabacterium sp. A7-Y TaxID=1349605 RepID=UPI00223DAF82|nr:protease HtpX [Aquabacterium sp. A7-Y]MCW7541423.1 protease HtpX [Aquabacterium sp. A7-Y]